MNIDQQLRAALSQEAEMKIGYVNGSRKGKEAKEGTKA